MTTLNDALTLLAGKLALDADDLIAYAAEDTHGGRGRHSTWAIDADEGKLLYALVRALKPERVIEIGTNEGVSALHLLAALTANKVGRLDSYDVLPDAGAVIPEPLHDRWTFHNEDAANADFPPADFVFEDGAHTLDFSLTVFAKLKALAPRIVVTHDYAMTTAHGDFYVKQAFDSVFPDGFSITLDGCERGLGVWVNPTWKPILKLEEPTPAHTDPTDALIEPQPQLHKASPVRKPAPKKPAAKKAAAKK